MRRLLGTPPALALLLLIGACGHDATAARRPDGVVRAVAVSVTQCGSGWTRGTAGSQDLDLHNTDSRPGDVQLISPADGSVYAEMEPLAPGATRRLHVTLAAGTYTLRCLMEDEAAVSGPAITIRRGTGPAPHAPAGVVPADQAALVPSTIAYQASVVRALPRLVHQARVLSAAIESGDRVRAEAAWLPAHLAYERLGAAYDAFGDLDEAINGRPEGMPLGTADPGWTGFHRIEHGLWHGTALRALRGPAGQLVTDLAGLRGQLRTTRIDPLTLTVRAHEIMENALQVALTGGDDYGSSSELGTVRANLTGTDRALRILAPLLTSRRIDARALRADVQRAAALVDAQRRDGRWTPLDQLDRADRERVDAAISELTERLATVAAVLEPRRTS